MLMHELAELDQATAFERAQAALRQILDEIRPELVETASRL